MIDHLVIFKWKPEVTSDGIKSAIDATQDLATIEGVLGIKHFPNMDVAGPVLGKGFNHVMIVTFDKEASLDAYRPHPTHLNVGAVLQNVVADILVLDYQVAG